MRIAMPLLFLPSSVPVSVPLSSSVPISVSTPVPVPVSVTISASLTTPLAFSVPRATASSTLAVTLSTAWPATAQYKHISKSTHSLFPMAIYKACHCVSHTFLQALALKALHTRNRESYRYIPFSSPLRRMVSVAAAILLFFIFLVVCWKTNREALINSALQLEFGVYTAKWV